MKFVIFAIALLLAAVHSSEQVRRYYSNMYDKTAHPIDGQVKLEYQDCIDHVKYKHRKGASEDPRFQRDLENCAKVFKSHMLLGHHGVV